MGDGFIEGPPSVSLWGRFFYLYRELRVGRVSSMQAWSLLPRYN